jgi:hypothetical protein
MTSQKIFKLVKKFFPGSVVLPPEIKNFKPESEKITVSQAGRILSMSRKRKNNLVDKNQLILIK